VKVFISSVRRSLEAERDAMRGLILALEHEPRRFEDFTAQPVPSREACLQGVRDADVYLLLLGERSGDPLPDTGAAPTEEEFAAARARGIPILVFLKRGIAPDDRQKAFIDRVSNYVDGRFRRGFDAVPDLLISVAEALREVAARPTALTWTDLPATIVAPWRETGRNTFGGGGTEVETYVLPVGVAPRLSATVLNGLPDRLARTGRDGDLFGHDRALDLHSTDAEASAAARREVRLLDAGLRVGRDRVISIWEQLPTDMLGAILDEQDVAARIAKGLRLAADLGLANTDEVAVAVGLQLGSMTAFGSMADLGRRRESQPIGFMSGTPVVRVEAQDSIPASALAEAAAEVASEMARRLIYRVRELR
jgi:hypothetical protein